MAAFAVALLAEGVDRNFPYAPHSIIYQRVALLAEGVDRNMREAEILRPAFSRPPRGGRG